MTRRGQGVSAWLVQRVTAVLLAGATLYFAFYFPFAGPDSAAAWRATIAQLPVQLALSLYLLALLAHTWVGMRDVVLDYLHPFALRICALVVLALGLIVCALWGLGILWRVQPA